MAFYYLIYWVRKLIVWHGIHWSGVAASGESSDEPSATSQESGYNACHHSCSQRDIMRRYVLVGMDAVWLLLMNSLQPSWS